MDDANELVSRLSTAAGIIMEDTTPAALSPLAGTGAQVSERLDELEQAMGDATVLVHAAKVLARRNIR